MKLLTWFAGLSVFSTLAGASVEGQEVKVKPVVLATVEGAFRRGAFGADVAFLADLDGDGRPEWAAGRTGPPGGVQPPALRVQSGIGAAPLYEVLGTGTIGSLFLESIADLGDVDGDGVGDFAYGNANAVVGSEFNVGSVRVVSGATGRELYVREGITSFGGFGASLARVGDVDGDGVPDFAAGAIGTLNENAWLVSGRSGAILRRVRGPSGLGDIEFGWSCAATGDVDGDSVPDFAVGTRSGGLVDVVSGIDGSLVRRVWGSVSFGRVLADAGDVTGDGLRDLLVGVPGESAAVVLSGLDGSVARRHLGAAGSAFGTAVGGGGDVDGDGVADYLVGDPAFERSRGRVDVISGRSGDVLVRLEGEEPRERFGAAVAIGGDLDGDGRADILVGAPDADGARPRAGVVRIVSVRLVRSAKTRR